jgi:aminoglycoside phosphotransferase (APT) family kinase protein
LNDQLAAVVPELAGAATPLLARLAAAAAAHPAEPLRPAHGSFRPAQVLLHQNRVGFIDFDGFGQAEPARDLALFLWNIKSVGLNTAAEDDEDEPVDAAIHLDYLDQLDHLAAVFLTEYQAGAPRARPRLALWEALNLLTLVLEDWIKVQPGRLKNMIFLLERHLRASGIA